MAAMAGASSIRPGVIPLSAGDLGPGPAGTLGWVRGGTGG
jgi:hypothetical protein